MTPAPLGAPSHIYDVDAPAPADVILACVRAPAQEVCRLCRHPSIDWPRVAAEATLHRVGPLVLDALQRGGAIAAGSIPPEVVATLRAERRAQTALATKLDATLRAVLDALLAAGVRAIVLKGVTLARLYQNPALRPRSDLDLLVDPADWPAAERILAEMGFVLLDARHRRRPRLSDAQAPEDRQYQRADGLLIELHADFLHTGFLRREDADIWRRAQVVDVQGLRAPALAPDDLFLQVTAHMQRHSYTRLLWFYDLALLLRAEGQRIAWAEVAGRAERAGVATAAYYGLSYTEALFGPIAPPAARIALMPHAIRRRLHEGHWPRRRILALDAEAIRLLDARAPADLPARTFDAYSSPRRMLIDVLMNGGVGPKARILARRFLPPEDWLRYNRSQDLKYYRARLMAARLIALVAAKGRL